MESSTTQDEKRIKLDYIVAQRKILENLFDNTENLMQNRFDENITTNLPAELQNIHPTITECHILQKISENGSMNGSQLAKRLSMTRGGITKVMAKLMEKNLVSRETYPNNRKEIYYVLTMSGKKIAEIHEMIHEKMWEQITMALAEYDYAELRIFENILTRIMNLLDDDTGVFKVNDI